MINYDFACASIRVMLIASIITTLIVIITGLLKFELVKFIIAQKYEFFNYHYFLSTISSEAKK